MNTHRTDIGAVYGPVHTGSGDIIIADFERAFRELAKLLTADHPAFKSLRSGLQGLAIAYERLNEWKELHHQLQSLLIAFDAFRHIVERASGGKASLDAGLLEFTWLQCKIRLDSLKMFASGIKYIGDKGYEESERGVKGEPWVVDLVIIARDIEQAMRDFGDLRALRNLADDFGAKCFTYLDYVDRKLREEATQIYGVLQSLRGRIGAYGTAEPGS